MICFIAYADYHKKMSNRRQNSPASSMYSSNPRALTPMSASALQRIASNANSRQGISNYCEGGAGRSNNGIIHAPRGSNYIMTKPAGTSENSGSIPIDNDQNKHR